MQECIRLAEVCSISGIGQVGTSFLNCLDECGSDASSIRSCRSSRGLPFSGSKDFRTGKEATPWLLRV